jgi:hypothetical protein
MRGRRALALRAALLEGRDENMTCPWQVLGTIAGVLFGTCMAQAQQGALGTITGTITDVDAKTPISDVAVIVAEPTVRLGRAEPARAASSMCPRVRSKFAWRVWDMRRSLWCHRASARGLASRVTDSL